MRGAGFGTELWIMRVGVRVTQLDGQRRPPLRQTPKEDFFKSINTGIAIPPPNFFKRMLGESARPRISNHCGLGNKGAVKADSISELSERKGRKESSLFLM